MRLSMEARTHVEPLGPAARRLAELAQFVLARDR
jgi:hypothetical protein